MGSTPTPSRQTLSSFLSTREGDQTTKIKRGFWSAGVLLLYVVLLALIGIRAVKPPRLPAENPPSSEFSAERAVQPLKVITSRFHPLGSAAHDDVRDNLLEKWKELGFEPEVQRSKDVFHGGSKASAAENILVRLDGSASQKAVMLVGHYDSTDDSFGAADDGAGVAAILETARALKAGPPLKNDVIFLMTDGEEKGMIGARIFVREHPWAKDVGVVLNLEARGSSGSTIMFETSGGNAWLIKEFAEATPFPCASSLAVAVYKLMPYDGDMTVFKSAGMQGLNFAFIDKPWNIHAPSDTLENLDLRSLQHLGITALALARHFGSISLQEKSPTDAVYFNVMGSIFVSYPMPWATVLVFLLGGILIAAGLAGFRKKAVKGKTIALGISILLGNLILSASLAALFHKIVVPTRGRWSPADRMSFNVYYLIAVVIFAAGASYVIFRLFGSRISLLNQAFVSSAVWTVLAAVTAVALPVGSYLFAWPAFFTFIPLLGLLHSGENASRSWREPTLAMIGTTPAVLLFSPSLYLFFIAVGFNLFSALVTAAVSTLIFWNIFPALENLRERRQRQNYLRNL